MYVKVRNIEHKNITSIKPNKPTPGTSTLYRKIGNHVVLTKDIITIKEEN